ncbi:hypothetical protein IAU59_007313 [Kwoniella sp. CBS 9459]
MSESGASETSGGGSSSYEMKEQTRLMSDIGGSSSVAGSSDAASNATATGDGAATATAGGSAASEGRSDRLSDCIGHNIFPIGTVCMAGCVATCFCAFH